MFRDAYGLVVDSTNDGGDSACYAGLAALFGSPEPLSLYYTNSPVRHPFQIPWNNPKNFSRDQLIPYMAGLWRQSADQNRYSKTICRKIFWHLARRFFFCFNSERDYVGSTKYPWPHRFINDRGLQEHRSFDAPDFIFPHVFLFMLVCCRYNWFYWVGFLGYPLIYLSIILNSKKIDSEQSQLIALTKVMGPRWVALYKKYNSQWQQQVYYYFVTRRQMPDMYELIVRNY